MAQRRKKRTSEPLRLGDVFTMHLPDGRYGAVRVIRGPTKAEAWNEPNVSLVVATQYVGHDLPAIDDPALRRLMIFRRGNIGPCEGRAEGSWLSGPVPAQFVRIGTIAATAAELKIPCNTFSDWECLPDQLLRQWRWDHDRPAYDAEIAEIERQHQAVRAEAERRDREKLATMSYSSFRAQPMFQDWSDHHPPKIGAASRRIMRDTATKLEKLGRKPNRAKARNALRDCILAFNKLDEENDHWIATIEREEICERFYELVHLAGFDDEPDLADEWRDW